MSPPRSGRSTRQLATDVPSSDDALISHDLTGIITSWNRQAGQIFGRSESEAVGHSIRLIVPPDLYEEEDEVLRRIGAGESLDHYDTVRVRKDGQRLDVSLTVSPLAAPGGEIVGASIIARVITERKRHEREARCLAAIVDSSDDAIISKDLHGTITSWNRAAERVFGHAAGAVIGQSIRLIIPDDRQAEEDRVLEIVKRGEIVDHFETVRLRKDGTRVPISLTVSPIRSATGTIVGISKIARDLTATRQHEALLQIGALQSAIFNSVNFSSIATDAKGVIQIFNVGAERMLGYAAAEVLNRVTPADLSDPQEVIARAQALSVEFSTPIAPGFEALVFKASRGIEDIYELTYIRKDGSRFPAVVSVAALRDAHRAIIGYLLIGTDNTARKRADTHLLLQGAALNAAANAMVITDRAGLIEWVNPAFSDLTGYTAAEALGQSPAALVKSDHHDQAFYQNLWQTILSGQVWRGETINRRKDGSLYTEDQAITPVRDAQGEICHFIAVKEDITARKRAEEALSQRAQLSALRAAVGLSLSDIDSLAHALQRCAEALVTHLEAALARIWTLNERDGVLELQASAGLYTHLDGPHGKVPLGQFKIGRIARDGTPHVTNTVVGDPQVHDQEWARREGMVAFAGYPLIVEGRVVGVMALFARHALSDPVIAALASIPSHIALGIEHHRSAEAVRTAEERMRFALEAAGVGIWDMDYSTGVLRWSETLEAHYGLQPGTFGGTYKALVECIHPDDRESALGVIEKAVKSGGEFERLNRALWPDGTVRWLRGIGRILLGEHGEPVRGIGISLDVTERHSLEQQFQQAQKMEAIGRLAGGVAHDFNNLLTVILGFCGLLLADLKPGDPHQADLEEIQKAGTRGAGLTRQLLAFSRKQIIEPTRLDLNVVVAEMRVMLGRLIGEDVKVVVGLGPDLARMIADRGQVEQVVLNLAVNARDAMPKGGTLTIDTANVELDEHYARTHLAVKPGPYVVLSVSDTGTGMTPDVQARLFEPFFTTKEVGKGTGLGLATVHGIVRRSGGSVGVYSELGRGTSFKVYFPRADAAEIVVEAPAPVARPVIGVRTVLVVEDEREVSELAKRLLERQGYTVLIAANAEEARHLFEQNPSIDVLLTDVVMPGASGPELTKQLVERRPTLKVIYMSGYTEDAIVEHGVVKPGIAFLQKPFTSDTLGRKVREVLDG